MDDYGSGYESTQERFADVRALREQRRQEREAQRGAPSKKKHAAPRDDRPLVRREPLYYENGADDLEDEEPPPKGGYGRVVFTQAVVCAVLLGGLFLCQKAMPNTYAQLKAAYVAVMKTDMSVQEVWAAARQVFKELKDGVYVMAPYYREVAEEPTEAAQHETAPPPAADEALDGQGGDDLEAAEPPPVFDIVQAYAGHKCSAATLLTTLRPYLPVEGGRVTSNFGYRVSPLTNEEGVHTGIDIAAPLGTPVHAAFYGTVSEVGVGKEYGNYIILDHAGGLRTLYAHCSEIIAEEGMVLRSGDVIALVGSTGASTGPHVHFELRLHGLRCDPAPALGIAAG
ncbi:MAG: M23 family metallopeptidase [Oscillospiraceae bacterium]|jgi:murein DD-endopeptidase MepM/ murein hydrolase activator NlpD|nr:M23 family metallopeptidase [Oscillospiraceae bacterium]